MTRAHLHGGGVKALDLAERASDSSTVPMGCGAGAELQHREHRPILLFGPAWSVPSLFSDYWFPQPVQMHAYAEKQWVKLLLHSRASAPQGSSAA